MSRAFLSGVALATLMSGVAYANSAAPLPRPAPDAQTATAATAPTALVDPAVMQPRKNALSAAFDAFTTGSVPPARGAQPGSSDEIAALDAALSRFKAGDLSGALAYRANLRDPGALALIDWLAIRFASRQVGFARLEWFLRNHPDWPTIKAVRARAEEALWNDEIEPARVRAFFGSTRPTTEEGKMALARALLAGGEATAGAAWVRDAYRNEVTNAPFEAMIAQRYGAMLTKDDYRHRAELLFFAGRVDQALAVAANAGSDYLALARARAAVLRKAGNATALLQAVPGNLKNEPGYYFALAQHLRRSERYKDAAKVMIEAPKSAAELADPDEWWVERRLLARELIEIGDPKTAYVICRDHAARSREDRAEAEFHAGWIALRFLKDPSTASRHFAVVLQLGTTAITNARANYWLGRAAEAAGSSGQARQFYENASRMPTVYYGQLARNRLGGKDLALRQIPDASAESRALFDQNAAVRALKLLYRMKERELALSLAVALAETLDDAGQLGLLAQMVSQQMDVRTMLAVGKSAVSRGYPLENLAYPTIGIPAFTPRGANAIEKSVVYAIARQESAFNPAAVSPVGARGLLQLMPATAQRTAKSVGLGYDVRKLTTDPAYNATLGAAHLGDLVDLYNGSYVMTFAAYNAGPGRVRDWVARYGDPRTGQIDPIDWVELIPFTETRNYVMRVMENVQVYRARLTGRGGLMIEADLSRGRKQ